MRNHKGGVCLYTAMLAGDILSDYVPFQPKKVNGKEGTNPGKFDIDLFTRKEKYKELVENSKHLEEVNNNLYYLFDDK